MAPRTNQFQTAQLIEDGDEQIVVLPASLRLPGEEVTITRLACGILIKPTPASSRRRAKKPAKQPRVART